MPRIAANRKYEYWKVIQTKYKDQTTWEDCDHHACDSTGYMNAAARKLLNENLKEYRFSARDGEAYRVIFRKELKLQDATYSIRDKTGRGYINTLAWPWQAQGAAEDDKKDWTTGETFMEWQSDADIGEQWENATIEIIKTSNTKPPEPAPAQQKQDQ